MDHRAPNCQQLINIYLLNIEACYSDSFVGVPSSRIMQHSEHWRRQGAGKSKQFKTGVCRWGMRVLAVGES